MNMNDYWDFLDREFTKGEIIEVEESYIPYDDCPFLVSAVVLKSFNKDTVFDNTKFKKMKVDKYEEGDMFKYLVKKGYLAEVERRRLLVLGPTFEEK